MNRKLIFALFVLFLAGLLTTCNGKVPLPSVPTTAIPESTVWDITEQMLAECDDNEDASKRIYVKQLFDRILEIHPEFQDTALFRNSPGLVVVSDNGTNPNPFTFVDDGHSGIGWLWGNEAGFCQWYFLIYENVPENSDGDEILVGEAYLFYEVGGTELDTLDGELKEVNFFFPDAP